MHLKRLSPDWDPAHPYRVTTIEQAYWAMAARYAVFRPILGVSDVGDPFVAEHLDHLRDRWHKRLKGLATQKWQPTTDSKSFGTMWYCPPFGVKTDTRGRPCRRCKICPFCYARRHVMNPFFNLLQLCYGTLKYFYFEDEAQEKRVFYEPIERQVIEFSTTTDFPRPGTLFKDMLADLKQHRRDEIQQMTFDGAYVNHTIQIKRDRIRVRRRGLIVCRYGEWLDGTESRRVRSHPAISRKVLAEMMGRVCRYPGHLLLCPAVEAGYMLDKLEDVKLTQTYGGMRNARAIRESREGN